MDYQEQTQLLQKKLIICTLKCLSVSLRQHQSILDFLNHKDALLLRIIQLMKQYITVGPVIRYSLMVLKQIFCAVPDVYDLVDQQLEAQYFKTFLTRIMLLYTKEDVLTQELTFLCLMQIESRGQALAERAFSNEKIADVFQDQVRKLVDPILGHLCRVYCVNSNENLAERLLEAYQYFTKHCAVPSHFCPQSGATPSEVTFSYEATSKFSSSLNRINQKFNMIQDGGKSLTALAEVGGNILVVDDEEEAMLASPKQLSPKDTEDKNRMIKELKTPLMKNMFKIDGSSPQTESSKEVVDSGDSFNDRDENFHATFRAEPAFASTQRFGNLPLRNE